MNKGDAYIILCFLWGTLFVLGNFYISYQDWEPLPSGVFTFATALIAGEVLALSAYKAFTYKKRNSRSLEDDPEAPTPKHVR